MLLAGAQYKNAAELFMLSDSLSFEPYAIVLPRGDWKFRLAVNTALAELYRRSLDLCVHALVVELFKQSPRRVYIARQIVVSDLHLWRGLKPTLEVRL